MNKVRTPRLPKWTVNFKSGKPAPMLPVLSYCGIPAATAEAAEAIFHGIHAPHRYEVVEVKCQKRGS